MAVAPIRNPVLRPCTARPYVCLAPPDLVAGQVWQYGGEAEVTGRERKGHPISEQVSINQTQ